MMRGLSKSLAWVHGTILSILILSVSAVLVYSYRAPSPDAQSPALPVYSTLTDFSLVDQKGRSVTRESLLGTLWVADFVFTRCGGPCPKMSRQMERLQTALDRQPEVRLVTITADPDHDTSAVLNRYSERFSADAQRWLFLTGEKRQIQDLAADGFKVVVKEDNSTEDLFIHTTKFMLVDRLGRVRGYYDGTEPGVEKEVLAAARILQKEAAR